MRKSLKIVGFVAAMVGGAWAGFTYWNRPTVRPELVGRWQGDLYKDTIFDLRADGTYASRSIEILVAGGKPELFQNTGEWKATRDRIFFKAVTGDAVKNRKKVALIPTGEWAPMPIRWDGKSRWRPTEVGIGHFQKVP